MIQVINENFDPFLSVTSMDAHTGEHFIVTNEWDDMAGNYWAISASGFKDQHEAEEWLNKRRAEDWQE